MSTSDHGGQDKEDGGENEDESALPEHSLSMRRACQYCEKLFELVFESDGLNTNTGHGDDGADAAARGSPISDCSVELRRERRSQACEQFWSQPSPQISILKIDPDKDGNIRQEQVWHFQDAFQNQNLPCLVLGLDRTHFHSLNLLWRNVPGSLDQNCGATNIDGQSTKGGINRQWFLDTLGDDFMVPLRYHEGVSAYASDEEKERSLLDADGRALECKTIQVTLKDWVEKLDQKCNEVSHDDCNLHETQDITSSSIYYLKDWHLQQELLRQTRDSSKYHALYSRVGVFEHDMLNSFTTQFTGGDYRFCYWGPARSSTLRHSDVLHSFSWSYNVVGTKKWTFYGPCSGESKGYNGTLRPEMSLSMLQEAGQAMFVPATWQHTVVNLEETISVNHNWVTAANLDLTWECLCTEMVAIEAELQRWGTSADHDMEACENMLRGCVGLDVTSFVFMTLVRLLNGAMVARQQPGASHINYEGAHNCSDYDQLLRRRHSSETSCLVAVLEIVLGHNQTLVQLPRRLRAVLQSDSLAMKAETMAKKVIEKFKGSSLDEVWKDS
jgi:JmjC domain, hydroxylase